jgi:RNA polymerase sigma factor (sigma-70 family)
LFYFCYFGTTVNLNFPSLTNTDDISLWHSFLDGKFQAFEKIYTLYYRSLYEYGMRHADNEELIKDSIQDLFVKLWSNRRNLSSTDNIKYYLFIALKNQLINAQATSYKKQTAGIEEAEFFKMEFSADSVYMQQEKYKAQSVQLSEALNQLTPRQKEVIYLRYFEEIEYEQIAELMNISIKGVYKLNYRALDALKEILNISKQNLLLLLLFCRMHSL